MNENQVKQFVKMCALYEQVGELSSEDTDELNTIETLANAEEYSAINVLYGNGHETADKAFNQLYTINLVSLNHLAFSFGFSRIEAIEEI